MTSADVVAESNYGLYYPIVVCASKIVSHDEKLQCFVKSAESCIAPRCVSSHLLFHTFSVLSELRDYLCLPIFAMACECLCVCTLVIQAFENVIN